MSGVVSPVVTCSSAVVTPSVPMLADGWPAIRQSWRVSSTFEVLPLVPVTATTVSGKGWKNLRREPGEFAARLVGGDVDRAFDLRLGPRRPPRPRRRDRVGDEILAVEARAAEGAEHGARRDLAVVDGEAGDGRRLAAAGQRAEAHQCLALRGDRRHQVRRVDVAAVVGDDAEQRAGARDHARHDRRGGPGGGGQAEGVGGRPWARRS